MAKIVSEVNDLDRINVEAADIDREIARGLPGSWDAAEYGVSREQAAQMLRDADTPERRAEVIKDLKARAVARAGLDTTGGKVAVMVAGEPPWHGLGVNVAEAVDSADALRLAGLDWKVEIWKSAGVPPGNDLPTIEAPEARHIVRLGANRVLGTVGTRYEPLQNEDAFEFVDGLVGARLCMYETAGSLNGGKSVWMLARIPKSYYAAPDDETKPYVLLSNSHDGSKALTILPTTVRVVCQNTLNLSLKNGGSEKALHIRHTASLKNKVEAAKTALGLVTERLDRFGEQMRALAAVQVTEPQVRQYVEQFFPTRVREGGMLPATEEGLLESIVGGHAHRATVTAELLEGHFAETERAAARNRNILETILGNFEDDPAGGTAWGALNAITEYADHQQSFRGKDKANARLQSAWFGGGNDLKQEALSAAMQFVR